MEHHPTRYQSQDEVVCTYQIFVDPSLQSALRSPYLRLRLPSAPAHPLSPQKISQSEEGGPINLFRMTKVASIADRSVARRIDRLQSGPVTSRKSFRNWDGRALALRTCGDQSWLGFISLMELLFHPQALALT